MGEIELQPFSRPVSDFHGRALPEPAVPAGYAALIEHFGIKAPTPRLLSAIAVRHRRHEGGGWRILTPRHAPAPTLEGHLTFAVKNEGLDLALLKRLFQTVGSTPIRVMVLKSPAGSYARRIWFLYEWLTGQTLDLPPAAKASYADIVDGSIQYAGAAVTSTRHRVRNNLPGTPEFCPLVFRTPALEAFMSLGLKDNAWRVVAETPRELIARAAAFLLLKDSKSSFAIEGEQPPQDRLQRWGRAIGEAGRKAIDLDELLRLQSVVIGDARFVRLGLRTGGGFVGDRDRETGAPFPAHISARAADLPSLMRGLIAYDAKPELWPDPVIAAAALAFGFVYVHPFEDGNGRIHRYLIHQVLAQAGFTPPGIAFPVSAAILDAIDQYRRVLESYSARLLPLIDWRATPDGNVEVLNDTADFYRFFDATPHAEFLYACIQRAVDEDLPNETEMLRRYDRFREAAAAIVEMPERTADLLFRFLDQNNGHLSDRAKRQEFAALSPAEIDAIEKAYAEVFKRAA